MNAIDWEGYLGLRVEYYGSIMDAIDLEGYLTCLGVRVED